jgi:hypothetical protein
MIPISMAAIIVLQGQVPPSEAGVPREQILALTKAIQSDAFEVERVESVLRSLFRTDAARRAFLAGYSAGSPSDPHVHARDLGHLAEALTDYAVRAAGRGERTRTRRALRAAVDVSLLPTSLVPLEARNGYASPRSAVALAAAFIGDALRSMESTQQSSAFEPALVTVGRIKAAQRHFARLILAARDEEVLEPMSLEILLAEAELSMLAKELTRLRGEISGPDGEADGRRGGRLRCGCDERRPGVTGDRRAREDRPNHLVIQPHPPEHSQLECE